VSKTVLFPIPSRDFDPTETAVPWRILKKAGVQVVFATPEGQTAEAGPTDICRELLSVWQACRRHLSRRRPRSKKRSARNFKIDSLRKENYRAS
jgi:hypothetical protein